MRLVLLTWIALTTACFGQGRGSPQGVKNRVDAFTNSVGKADYAKAQSDLNLIPWREVTNIQDTVLVLAKAVPKGASGKRLLRQIKTQCLLLDADPKVVPNLSDVEAYAVPIIRAPSVVVKSETVTPEVVYAVLLDRAQARWDAIYEQASPEVTRTIPHRITALGRQRLDLERRLTQEGWTPQVEQDWQDYYRALAAALGRRERLSNRK